MCRRDPPPERDQSWRMWQFRPRYRTVNGRNNQAVEGARVFGHKTNSHGKAKIVVNHTGTVRLKARKQGTIRSNELDVAIG